MKKIDLFIIFILFFIPLYSESNKMCEKLYESGVLSKTNNIILVEKVANKKDYCIPCHSVGNSFVQWGKIIKSVLKNNYDVGILYLGNLERKDIRVKRVNRDYLKNLNPGVYTIVCRDKKEIFYKKGVIDFNDYEKIMSLIKEEK